MPKYMKFAIAFVTMGFTLFTWNLFISMDARATAEQNRRVAQAMTYIDYGLYARSIPILRDIVYETEGDPNLVYKLAQTYRAAGSLLNYRSNLQRLLDYGIAPNGMTLADLYLEALEYDTTHRGIGDVITLLRQGVEATGDSYLRELLEYNRFAFVRRRAYFTWAGLVWGNAALVLQGNQWGFVNGVGNLLLGHRFETATNFIGNYAAVQIDGQLQIINRGGARQAIADFSAEHIAHFDGNTFVVMREGTSDYIIANWRSGNLNITLNVNAFEYLGRATDGIRPVANYGMWALHDQRRSPNIPFEFIYDSIALDEFGRAAVNDRIFIKQNGQYHMINYYAQKIGSPFDEARPFFERGGLAAVRRGDYWGFIDAHDNVIIDFIYEDARSSSFGLAPVKLDGLWGYITVDSYPEEYMDRFFGRVVIEPQFLDARQFVSGTAPVMNAQGWFYIVLIESQ